MAKRGNLGVSEAVAAVITLALAFGALRLSLLVESRRTWQWFYPLLIPWRHYVPVKADMSDLEEKVAFVLDSKNDALLHQLAPSRRMQSHARGTFVRAELMRDSVLSLRDCRVYEGES